MSREDTSGSDSWPHSVGGRSRRAAMILGLSLAAVGVAASWLVFVATRRQPLGRPRGAVRLLTIDRPFPAEGRYPGDPYAGSRVCAECHPGETALHSGSGHASTLLPAGRRALSRRLDGMTVTDPEFPEVIWRYQFRDGRLQIARTAAGQAQNWVVDYAFGSGHHATTFVNVLDPSIPTILEHRLSYYTREAALAITPSQDADSRIPEFTPHGNELAANHTRKCIRCHTTQMSARGADKFDEDTMIPNVSCERCHGASRAHVVAARRGASESELSLPFGPDRWTAVTLLKLCGECHRHPSGAQPGQISPDNPLLARFQPVGLMQSKCFVRSGGALSCVTCHDPHARASSNRASYDAKCLGCHGGQISVTKQANSVPAADPVCAVSPRERCVECHMPRVDSGQKILYSDHWIRIRREGESSLQIPSPVPNLDFPAAAGP
jgi:hypothetical protein